MKSNGAMMLLLAAGLLLATAGLRDIFAPGFLSMSPQVKSTFDIAMQFSAAAIFCITAAWSWKRRTNYD
ncbi:MAG TPA: hypothetical protein VIT88_12880 [Pyrinomonadaceae bacterium]